MLFVNCAAINSIFHLLRKCFGLVVHEVPCVIFTVWCSDFCRVVQQD